MKADNKQLRTIHFLLRSTGLDRQKQSLVEGATGGRETSSKELLYEEAASLIKYLQDQENNTSHEAAREKQAANQMRRKIISICHSLNWRKPDGSINMNSVNEFCKTKGYLKKELQEYTYKELPQLVSQFQQVYKRVINTRH